MVTFYKIITLRPSIFIILKVIFRSIRFGTLSMKLMHILFVLGTNFASIRLRYLSEKWFMMKKNKTQWERKKITQHWANL